MTQNCTPFVFPLGPFQVNSVEYDKVSDYIESGAIDVVPGKAKFSRYIPQRDTFITRNSNPPLDESVRSSLVHECTHAISDINKYDVTRLTDEAAAYIAQLTYALLLRPSLPEPPIGLPVDNMMRQSMHLVNKYELGSPAGYGAMIDQRDIADLARAVYAIPDYHNIDPDAKLAANGVALSDEQLEEFYRRQMQRLINQDTSGTDASLKAQYASYEDYVTSDNELLTLFDSYRAKEDRAAEVVARLSDDR